ncbi:MAG: diguanylate cyclase [Proteobacteria bacterium]|nr:diguanylate cyclase [Pseudomonadota bacterium]
MDGPREPDRTFEELAAHSQKIARLVLPFLSEYDMPVTPSNYRLWYEYFSGASPELKETLDRMLKEGVSMNMETTEALCNRFFSAESSEAYQRELEKRAARIKEMALDIIRKLLAAVSRTSQFGEDVSISLKEIEQAADLETIREIVADIVDKTDTVLDDQQNFRQSMENSAQELECLQEALRRSREMAHTDELTGLPNRRALNLKLIEEEQRARRYGRKLSLIMIDIDDFKMVNDGWGHQVGDRLLAMLARAISCVIRTADFPARYGGEEFMVVCPETEMDNAAIVAEKLRAKLDETDFTVRGLSLKVTISCGVAMLQDQEAIEDLVARADQALYMAKQQGKNQVRTETDLEKRE